MPAASAAERVPGPYRSPPRRRSATRALERWPRERGPGRAATDLERWWTRMTPVAIRLLTRTPDFRTKRQSTLNRCNGTSQKVARMGGLTPSKRSWPRQPTNHHDPCMMPGIGLDGWVHWRSPFPTWNRRGKNHCSIFRNDKNTFQMLMQKVVFEVYTLENFGYVTLCYSHIQILAFFTRLYTHVFISTRRINVNQAVPWSVRSQKFCIHPPAWSSLLHPRASWEPQARCHQTCTFAESAAICSNESIASWVFGPFIDDFPSYKPPFIQDFPWLC